MARYAVYKGSLDGTQPILKRVAVGANQTIKKGYLLALSSGKAVIAASGAADGTILGVAAQDITTGASPTAADVIKVDVNPNSIYEFRYAGTTKTSLNDADLGATFDLGANAYTVNLDDTTGAYLHVVGYNNTKKSVDAVIKNRALK
jgi:hypothetical protein